MRKLLLSLACIASVTVWAEDVTTVVSMASAAPDGSEASFTWKQNGFNFTASKSDGQTNPTVNGNTNDLRIYGGGTFSVTTNVPIKSMSFAISDKGLKQFAEITPSVGAIDKQGANPLVWEGNDKSVTFSVSSGNAYGSDQNKSAGQFDFAEITIVTDGTPDASSSDQPTPDDPTDPEGVILKTLVTDAEDWSVDFLYPEDGSINPWTWDSKYGFKASSYINKVNEECESMAYIRVDLSEYTDCELTFDHALNYLNTSLYDPTYFVSLYGIAYTEDEEADLYWDYIDIPNWPAGNNWTFIPSGSISLKEYEGNWCALGLYYYSGVYEDEDGNVGEDVITCTWEVKNFVITGKNTTGVTEVIFDSNAPVEYYNLQGIRVENPSNGIYVRRQGKSVAKVLIK